MILHNEAVFESSHLTAGGHHDRIKAWTTTSTEELYQLMELGWLDTDARCSLAETEFLETGSANFLEAYEWMARELDRRTFSRPTAYPRWLWTRVLGQSSWSETPAAFYKHLPGTYALVEFEMRRENVLLSDYEAWHAPLNGWYLPLDEENDDEFRAWEDSHRGPNFALKRRQMVVNSWSRCLNVDDPPAYMSSGDTTQGVTWMFTRSEVTFAATFTVTEEDDAAEDGGGLLGDRLASILVDHRWRNF